MFGLPDWVFSFLSAGAVLAIAPIAPSLQPAQVATEATDREMWQRILTWEGGCSNHPSDKGGFTCLGITASLGRKHGVFNVRSRADREHPA